MADNFNFNDAATSDEKPISAALAYARRGWPVFPCNPLNKRPLVEHGLHAATTDALRIRAWWSQWPKAMIGIPTGPASGFWVLDIDTDRAKGKDGLASLAEHGHDLSDLTDTAVANTASGGYHCLYRFDPDRPVTNARGALRRHIDVRGSGGYIVAAGSARADGNRYTWLNHPDENEISDAPEWLLDLIFDNAAKVDGGGFDFNTAARAPKAPVERVAAISPGSWHENTRDLVARMVREGASDDTIAAIAHRFTEPGYSHEQTVREFLTHAATARAKWGYQPRNIPQEQAAQAAETEQRFRILTIEELVNVKPPEWRIDGIFPTHGASTLYGAYETFKTFVAVDLTLACATGRPWQGLDTKPCSVLYIAGEGQVGLGMRVAGWLSAKGIASSEARFRALPEAVAIPSPGEQDALLRAIDRLDDRPEIIVLDTVTRMTGGGSLNDEKDAQAYVRGMDRLRLATGAHILNIGHSGKDKERGILGSTVLPAAMETIICVERRGDTITLINSNPKGKQKEGPNFEDIRLRTQKISFPHLEDTASTIILMPDDSPVEDTGKGSRSAAERHGGPRGTNQEKVMKALKKATGEALGMNRLTAMTGLEPNRVTEAARALVGKGLAHETGEAGTRQWTLA